MIIKPINQSLETYRKHLKLTDEQVIFAAGVVETCRNQGIFYSPHPLSSVLKPGLLDSSYSRYWHEQSIIQTSNRMFQVEFNIRFYTAYILRYIMDFWELQQPEAVDQFYQILLDTKPVLASQNTDFFSSNNGEQTCAEADLILLNFVDSILNQYLIPSTETNSSDENVKWLTDSIITGKATDKMESVSKKYSSLIASGLPPLIDQELSPSEVQPYPPALEKVLQEGDQLTANKFLKRISQNPFSSFDPVDFNSPILPTAGSAAAKSSNDISRYTTSELITCLDQTDIDLLSSLPWESTQACPTCFSRSLAERKTETEAGKHYCSACRKRVKAAYVPYYIESRTADPQVAISRHRHYLTTQLNNKILDLKRLETLKVSTWKRRCYFISIDQIDENVYNQLAALYDQFYTDYSFDEPETKLQIQLCSNGGNVKQAKRLIALINANKHITHLQGTVLFSAAFDIFFSVECTKELAQQAQGMYHLGRSAYFVLENGLIPDRQDVWDGQSSLTLCSRIGMTAIELDRIKQGEDVYFSYDRLKEFVNYEEGLYEMDIQLGPYGKEVQRIVQTFMV